MGGVSHSSQWLAAGNSKLSTFWVGDQHQRPRPHTRVGEGEKVVVERQQPDLPVVFEVCQLQFEMAAGVPTVHARDESSDRVKVAADVSHGACQELPQLPVVGSDGAGGVVAEPERVVVALRASHQQSQRDKVLLGRGGGGRERRGRRERREEGEESAVTFACR